MIIHKRKRIAGLILMLLVLIGCSRSTPQVSEESNDMSRQHHSVNYIELPMADHASTKNFYESVFGWEFQDYGPDYMCFTGAGIDLGFSRELEPAATTNGVLVVLYSKELEQTEAAIKQAGLQVVKETFEFPGGRRFHFTDPNGNEIAVWSESASE